MIVVDANFLIILLDPDSSLNHGVDRAPERVNNLVACSPVEEFVIPAPVIAEFCSTAEDGARQSKIIQLLTSNTNFRVEPFGTRAAIETGALIRKLKLERLVGKVYHGSRHVLKYDMMIAGTALALGADKLCTGDGDFKRYLARSQVNLLTLADLPLPPEPDQGELLVDLD